MPPMDLTGTGTYAYCNHKYTLTHPSTELGTGLKAILVPIHGGESNVMGMATSIKCKHK